MNDLPTMNYQDFENMVNPAVVRNTFRGQDWYYEVTKTISDPEKPFPYQTRFCTKCRQEKTTDHWSKSTLYGVYSPCRECKSASGKQKHLELKGEDHQKQTKRCLKCKQEKDFSMFWKRFAAGKTYLYYDCRDCQKTLPEKYHE